VPDFRDERENAFNAIPSQAQEKLTKTGQTMEPELSPVRGVKEKRYLIKWRIGSQLRTDKEQRTVTAA
jgi:hypothetical protein